MTTERRRDRLGRPLPAGAPASADGPPVPSVEGWTDGAVWELGLDFLDRELPFHAHEIFEQRWRSCAPADRDAWRALAQWAAAETHRARGNLVGASRLARRAADLLTETEQIPVPIDRPRVLASCRDLQSTSQ